MNYTRLQGYTTRVGHVDRWKWLMNSKSAQTLIISFDGEVEGLNKKLSFHSWNHKTVGHNYHIVWRLNQSNPHLKKRETSLKSISCMSHICSVKFRMIFVIQILQFLSNCYHWIERRVYCKHQLLRYIFRDDSPAKCTQPIRDIITD